MTEKIKLTREQADALEMLMEVYGPDEIIAEHIERYCGTTLNKLTTAELARALFVGYTVELTEAEKHEKVKEAYYGYKLGTAYSTQAEHYIRGISDTLDILEIKIEGVNA
ncbi:hypothetical protein [Alkalihalobacillus pseudalcaliphilus]|uniref:hypothetical protein n=1 Tax=Alkalihalobacillus pseudalcaliphilus TaxID=79884 RepID=UPI00064DE242|nr:hypothetical protein [Alkalihalobacillus pseudalcaliphilus]KMK75403.1 hypothetical protein AB990_08775 [Alkalihalobacillus pseudalcaliphilus]